MSRKWCSNFCCWKSEIICNSDLCVKAELHVRAFSMVPIEMRDVSTEHIPSPGEWIYVAGLHKCSLFNKHYVDYATKQCTLNVSMWTNYLYLSYWIIYVFSYDYVMLNKVCYLLINYNIFIYLFISEGFAA